jgi:hypothetical protein
MLITYTNGDRPTSIPARRHPVRRRLTGTAHQGPRWTNAVRILRVATQNAVEHAGWRRSATADQVGTTLIDTIGELDPPSLHVLAVVHGILLRSVQKRD